MKASNQRQLKAGELIKRTLAEIFYNGKILDKDLINVSVTISEVRVSPDLKSAKIFIFPMTGNIDKKIFIESLKKQSAILRMMLNKKVQLKFSPELIFVYDESFENVSRIENIIESLKS